MLEGLYKFIAKQIIRFFKYHDAGKSINPGSRYCLRLENLDLVDKVYAELHSQADAGGLCGSYTYHNESGQGIYTTYTIRLEKTEIVVASKNENTTDDFLTTLRNADIRNSDGIRMPVLMIVYSPIDSIVHGTGDLSANGMPFHIDQIINDIKDSLEENHLSYSERAVISWELNNMRNDRYGDNASLSSYGDILSILYDNKISDDDYPKLGLLPDPELDTESKESTIRKMLDENRAVFKNIDYWVKNGDTEVELSKKYDKGLVTDIMNNKKKNLDWFTGLTYVDVRKSREKKQKGDHNPLEFHYEKMTVSNENGDESRYVFGETVFVRPDSDKPNETKQNILIFNTERDKELRIHIPSNKSVPSTLISYNKSVCQSIASMPKDSGYGIEITLKAEGCSFGKVLVAEEKKVFLMSICVLDIYPDYVDDIKTKYTISVSKKKNGSYIRLKGIPDILTFNDVQRDETGDNVDTENFIDDQVYTCFYNRVLRIDFSNDYSWVRNDTSKYHCSVNFGGVEVPFELIDADEDKIKEITGKDAFLKKFENKKSLEYKLLDNGNTRISSGAYGYFAKKDFAGKLKIENKFIIDHMYAAVKHGSEYEPKSLKLSAEVQDAYNKLLYEFSSRKTLPSLAYYSDGLKKCAIEYVAAVTKAMESFREHGVVSASDTEILFLGCVFDYENESVISMTPFHPLNICYQLHLLEQDGVADVKQDELLNRLTPLYLIPYIKDNDEIYKAVEKTVAPEWREYVQVRNKRYQGARNFVQKLVCDKIFQYKKNFEYLFKDISNNVFCINLINMGDCREILQGLMRYFYVSLNDEVPFDEILNFKINIYEDDLKDNDFYVLSNSHRLRQYIDDNFELSIKDQDKNQLQLLLAERVQCFTHKKSEKKYEYAHLAFYEMGDIPEDDRGNMNSISTGISLGGIVSGVPSIFDNGWYKTGFGCKYAPKGNSLIDLASMYNSVYAILNTGSEYRSTDSIFTTIKLDESELHEKIYDSSNWVVFIAPKVDLSFFNKDEDQDLMIIHYSDQYTSSSGYDDITVTRKSQQYMDIISEQLKTKLGPSVSSECSRNLIKLFNAVNGGWLLKLITANSSNSDSNFSREKMSILSAVKVAMAYFNHPGIVWIPISLEELLRVSGGVGLSRKEGLFSASKLGFEHGPTCDDLLLVGIQGPNEDIKVYLHPIEVKIGVNSDAVIAKAQRQLENTYSGFRNALGFDEEELSLSQKLVRSFFMQLIIVSCEKMKLYEIYPEMKWDLVLDTFRENLLNEKFRFIEELGNYTNHGTIISFKKDTSIASMTQGNEVTDCLEFSEICGYRYMIMPIQDIIKDMDSDALRSFRSFGNSVDENNIPFERKLSDPVYEYVLSSKVAEKTKGHDNGNCLLVVNDPEYDANPEKTVEEPASSPAEAAVEDKPVETVAEPGMHIRFGTDLTLGKEVIWEPNNSSVLTHVNTGIIGMMGTGKTQFTKSVLAQVASNKKYNIGGGKIGILMFNFKTNLRHDDEQDFLKAVDARVLSPYRLPINPFSLANQDKDLLPVYVANQFVSTVSSIFHLGPKQEKTLNKCIDAAYRNCGIDCEDRNTWNRKPPVFDDIYDLYVNDDEINQNDSLGAVMDQLYRFRVFENDAGKTESLYGMLEDGTVIIDISQADENIQGLVAAIVMDQFYAQMKNAHISKVEGIYRQLTKLLVVDEADNFMELKVSSLKKILKEGREFGVGVILSTQLLEHFNTSDIDYSKYINTWVVHAVQDLKESDIDYLFQTVKKSSESNRIYEDIKKMPEFHSVVRIGRNRIIYMKDLPFFKLLQE